MSVIRYNSLREIMQADLARLPDKIKEGALEAINEAADFMVTIAKGYCPVDTGTLERSIRKEQSGNIIRVIAGGYQFLNPRKCWKKLSEVHLVTFNLELNVEQTYTEIRRLQTLLFRTVGLLRRLGLPEEIDRALAIIQRTIMAARLLYTSILALETASGPLGWALAIVGVTTAAVSVADIAIEG